MPGDWTGCILKIPSSPNYSTILCCECGAILFTPWQRTESVPEAQRPATGSSLAVSSTPSNHKHQVPWPSSGLQIFLRGQEELGWHTIPVATMGVCGTVWGQWACEWLGHCGGKGFRHYGSLRQLMLGLCSVTFETPFAPLDVVPQWDWRPLSWDLPALPASP